MQAQANIALTGFMGTGKTTVGHALARVRGMTFLDMDDEVERRAGKAISAIFADEGEAHFRSLERELVRELAGRRGLVIGTGGGIVINPDNIRDLAATGLVVNLRARPESILARVQHETHRPLLAVDDKLGRIRELLARRQALYDAVPHQVDTDGRAVDAIVADIVTLHASLCGDEPRADLMRRPESKIAETAEACRRREDLRSKGKTVVFTNGCFDILHAGHVGLLSFAREQGDFLIVGLNSDASIRRIKGPDRPVVPQADRALLLAALEAVDLVVLFEEDRVDRLIGDLLPDIVVKGAQWGQEVHGREVVEANGGRVVLAPMANGRSTTNIIGTIIHTHREREANG